MKWKPVHGVSRYLINENGDVKSLITNKIMRTKIDRYGYKTIGLVKDNGKKWYATIHRLVALTYIDNPQPDVFNQVNHIDGNKLNNHVSNLEWCSPKANVNHSYLHLLNNNTNHIEVTDVKKGTKQFYKSLKSFCKEIKANLGNVLPGILYSELNPIYGKYSIKILNIDDFVKKSNVFNFGKNIYVYDSLTKTHTSYPSINSAKLFTGLRGLHLDRCIPLCESYRDIGYIISTNPINEVGLFPDDLQVSDSRQKYLLKPINKYNEYDTRVVVLDYIKSEEYIFEDIDSVIKFITNKLDIKKDTISKGAITQAAYDCRLYCGFGVGFKYSLKKLGKWPIRTESEILSSRNREICYKYYTIECDDIFLVVSSKDMIRMFDTQRREVNLGYLSPYEFTKIVNSGKIKLNGKKVVIRPLTHLYPDKPITRIS